MTAKDDEESPASEEGGGFTGLLKKAGKAVKNAMVEPDEGDEDEDEKPAAKAKAPAKGAPRPVSYPPPPTNSFYPSSILQQPGSVASAPVDPEFAAILDRETAEAAKPAFTAFEATEKTLRPVLTDNAQRIKAAVAAVGGQGHTLPAILTDVDECLQALDRREADLRNSFEKKVKEKVGGLEQKAQTLGQNITSMDAEIARIQQEAAARIQQIQQQKAQTEQERQQALGSINGEREKLTGKLNGMLAAIAAGRTKWQDIKQTIKANTGA